MTRERDKKEEKEVINGRINKSQKSQKTFTIFVFILYQTF